MRISSLALLLLAVGCQTASNDNATPKPPVTDDVAQPVERFDSFDEARAVLKKSCADCVNGNKEQILAAIRTLEQAPPARSAAANIDIELYDAYGVLAAVHTIAGSSENTKYIDAQSRLCKRLLHSDQTDPDGIIRCAGTIVDIEQRIGRLAPVVDNHPKHAGARYQLGVALIQSGATERGVFEIQRAIELANALDAAAFGGFLISVFEERGERHRAEQLATQLRERGAYHGEP